MSVEMLNIWKVRCDHCGRETQLESTWTPSRESLAKVGYKSIWDMDKGVRHLCNYCFEKEEHSYE